MPGFDAYRKVGGVIDIIMRRFVFARFVDPHFGIDMI